MTIRVQRHENVSKQTTLLDGLDVSLLKCRVCGCGLNRFVHEGMNHISNVKVRLKTRSGNVNMTLYLHMYQNVHAFRFRKTSVYRNDLYVSVCNSRNIVSVSLYLVPL